MGRPRKPTPVLKMQGTFQPCRRPKGELLPPAAVPSCPSGLDVAAKREWRRVVKVLEPLGILSLADRAVLAAYCEAWSSYMAAGAEVQREGATITGSMGGPIQHPAVRTRSDAHKRMMEASRQIGLTPAARTAIGKRTDGGAVKSDEPNPILGLIGGPDDPPRDGA